MKIWKKTASIFRRREQIVWTKKPDETEEHFFERCFWGKKPEKPVYEYYPIKIIDPKTKKPVYFSMMYKEETREYSVPVRKLNPTLVLRDESGKTEKVKWNKIKKKLDKEQRIRLEERLKFEHEKDEKHSVVTFKYWDNVKEWFDKKSQKTIEKSLGIKISNKVKRTIKRFGHFVGSNPTSRTNYNNLNQTGFYGFIKPI